MPMPGKLSAVTRTCLQVMYELLEMSKDEIASYFGCHERTVLHHLRKHGINRRSAAEGRRLKDKHCPRANAVDWTDLQSLYEGQRLGCKAITKIKGCSPISVYEALQRKGIPVRTPLQAVTRGPAHHRYRHGTNAGGYCRNRLGGVRGLVHRQVAAEVLGRPLAPSEQVHHCNKTKTDNRPENLWVFPSRSAHASWHKTGVIHPDTIFLDDYMAQHGEEDQ